MTPIYVLLGKTGDIIGLLPALRLIAIEQSAPVRLMVAKDYADVLEGVSYVEPVIFDGEWMDLKGGVEAAAKVAPKVIVCQVAGKPDEVRDLAFAPMSGGGRACAITDSFLKDSWRLAGRWADWRKCPPLVFDKRSVEREAELVAKHVAPKKKWSKRRLLLVSLKGESSQFKYSKLLLELLAMKFKDRTRWEVVDISDVHADRIYDLLGLYEVAHMLISTDSAPLHLAAAVPKLPVLALIQDEPEAWNGSPWRPSHLFHCRYSEFPERAIEMLEHIESTGTPGNWFFSGVQQAAQKVIHVWSGYEDEVAGAAENRRRWYDEHWQWVELPVLKGALGRDSKSSIQDPSRFPYLKDVIGLATMRAGMDDVICLTRADTCIAKEARLGWSHRVTRTADGDVWSPAIDMVCFQRSWWETNAKDVPDLFLDSGWQWARVLRELLRETGGVEVEGGCWREAV